jgi:hypothetical protein
MLKIGHLGYSILKLGMHGKGLYKGLVIERSSIIDREELGNRFVLLYQCPCMSMTLQILSKTRYLGHPSKSKGRRVITIGFLFCTIYLFF